MPIEGSPLNPLTYLIYDVMTGILLAELPFDGVTFSQRLNTPGQFQATLNFLDPNIQKLRPGQIIQPGRTALFIDYEGVLIWGGMIWTMNFTRATAAAVPIKGKEWWSYFTARVQATDYTSPAWPVDANGAGDPMAIAGIVVNNVLNASLGSALAAGTGFPLTVNQNNGVPTPDSGWVIESYPYTQLQTVDTIVTNLTQMGYGIGFDYGMDVAYAPGTNTPTVTMNMAYPRRGQIASVDSVTVVTQASQDYAYPQDATQQGGTIYGNGSGSGQIQTIQSNPSVIEAGWPLLEIVNSYSNISSFGQLEQVVQGDLDQQSFPITNPQFTIPMFGDPNPTSYRIGDDIRWIIEPDERFPNGLDWYWRIVGLDFSPSSEGLSTVQFTLNLPPGPGAQQPPT